MVKVEVQDYDMSRIHLIGSTHCINTSRHIILQKVKESDIKYITFGKIGAFNIFTASKTKNAYVKNIYPPGFLVPHIKPSEVDLQRETD